MDGEKAISEKMIAEEEERLSILLINQDGYSPAVADSLVGESNEGAQNVEKAPQQADDESAKEVAPVSELPVLKLRKAMPPHVLNDLCLRDPKRARRIIANRMSASRAKEKKKVHIYMLETEVQNLQCEWNTTSARLTVLQTEGQALSDEQRRLKERVTMVMQRLRVQEELNEQIKKEVEFLRNSADINGNNYATPNDAQPAVTDNETQPKP